MTLNHGFKGGEINLPGLNVPVKLPNNVLFRYDGKVKSLSKNIARTELLLHGMISGSSNLINKIADNAIISIASRTIEQRNAHFNTSSSYLFSHNINQFTKGYAIAQKNDLTPQMSVFADGHESGHLLEKINKKEILQKILKELGINMDALIYQEEDFADISGMYALVKNRTDMPIFRTRLEQRKKFADVFGKTLPQF